MGLLTVLAGCQDPNSPDMGAVPPKPNPEVLNRLPEDVRRQMEGAKEREKAAAESMGSRMAAPPSQGR
ncbi:MAG: hypothetical protein N2109_10555 [Fimbriimonadales bacterium]|nr:hypothetical protein [Fimbriimonadales bacterium]